MTTTAAVTSTSPLDSSARLERLIADTLAEAQRQGASAAEAGASIESGLSVTVRMGDVETVEHNRDKGLGVTVYFGQRKGSASTSDFSAQAIRDAVAAACSIARYTAADPYAGLADSTLMAAQVANLSLHHPWALTPAAAIDLAAECEGTARETDARITNSEGASVSTHEGVRAYGNSHGFIGVYPTSRHSLSCSVIGKDGATMQRDYWYSVARDPADLDSAKVVGERAAQRTVRRLNARRVATCQVPVLFSAEVASSLVSHFVRAVSGSSQYRKASFLLDAVGGQVFPEFVRLHEQPHLPKGLGSAPFDNEGVATRAQDLVSEGVLRRYVLGSYSARRLGLETTGNAGGVHNLFIEGNAQDVGLLQRSLRRGLLVTELMGQGVNLVTGDYSRGAAGFWIENGEIQFPVEEITVAGNLRDMFQALEATGSDIDRRSNIVTGSLLIGRMTVAGS
ncbi:MAG: peptidase PmbA [Gammaproteobacteria bacterium SG8_47]|nr:MAG: peptidase PmbA [Gammaproteobacteria bacterium SG8_47]